ncbi:MAG: hypothetical protein R8N23_15895 [Reichenbachiella sp.]|uniref:hypothetical protein n=1 Tax=Reichenbachiella sp. TaxID=2184521 RepID=UPI002966887F|nr:hypothetical protein [Reichenbachiella sp.]MDW3211359.1 hypothetical protein [Reichenbachiella sp.]
MKTKIIITILGLMPMLTIAQPDFSQQAKQKLAALDLMVGNWEGTGYLITPTGKEASKVTEKIQYKLDKTVVVAEGKGVITLEDGTEQVVHNALGVISFNPFTKQYQMNSFISKGMSTQAKFEIKDANNMVWWIEAGPSTIRYSLTIKDGTWTEIGERSMDGENWQQFFEMSLKKVG